MFDMLLYLVAVLVTVSPTEKVINYNMTIYYIYNPTVCTIVQLQQRQRETTTTTMLV